MLHTDPKCVIQSVHVHTLRYELRKLLIMSMAEITYYLVPYVIMSSFSEEER